MGAMANLPKTSKMEERSVLNSFNQTISGDKPQRRSPLYIVEKSKNEQKFQSNSPRTSPLHDLKNKSKEELELIVKDEDSKTIAKVMCFSNPDAASKIIEDFPCSMLTDAIHNEIGLKYYCTESNKFAKLGETKQYLFEVIDPKKLILAKLKYSF
jgi:hypothetical protein